MHVLGRSMGFIPSYQNRALRSNFAKIWALDRLKNSEFLLGRENLSSAKNSLRGL